MNGRQLPERDYTALKCATRDLIKSAGDVNRAAGVTRVAASVLSRYGAAHESAFIPADVIADLEAETGEPVITRILAELAGYTLVPKAEAEIPASDLVQHTSEIAQEAGEVLSGLGQAMGDGKVDAKDAKDLLPKIHEAQETLGALEAKMEQVIDNQNVVTLQHRQTA